MDGFGPVYQSGRHILLVLRMELQPGIQTEVRVGWLPVTSMIQRDNGYPENTGIQKGEVATYLPFHVQLDAVEYAVEMTTSRHID